MRLSILLLFSILSGFNQQEGSPENKLSQQELIVFLQEDKDQFFRETCLEKLEAYAAEKEISLLLKSAEEGLPKEISSTPAIVYQNALGRSLYAGRYTDFSTIENFIRTSRIMPQQKADNCKTNVLTYTNGRTNILAPLKLTSLSGKTSPDWNQEKKVQEVKLILAKAMKGFKLSEQSCLQKSDRQFYIDIYPYLDEEDNLYLSLALYSQFSCIDPVYTSEQALKGKLTEANQMFAQAGQIFEREITRLLNASKNGDALSMVVSEIPVKSWKELELDLPKTSKSTKPLNANRATQTMPQEWVFYQALEEDLPALQFKFMEPLDRYTGEVKEVSGSLNFNKEGMLQSGAFEVATQSLTMGIADFDYKIHKKYIKAFKFPKASFEFQDQVKGQALEWGVATRYQVSGTFQLMRYKKPLIIDAQITPILDEDGQALLVVNAQFKLKIKDDFNIDGPDGPEPAKQTMIFAANFLMKATN